MHAGEWQVSVQDGTVVPGWQGEVIKRSIARSAEAGARREADPRENTGLKVFGQVGGNIYIYISVLRDLSEDYSALTAIFRFLFKRYIYQGLLDRHGPQWVWVVVKT